MDDPSSRLSSSTDHIDSELFEHSSQKPQGTKAFAAFPNNLLNINPTQYMWVKRGSNYTLCHKGSEQPRQARLWIVGDIDCHSLVKAEFYDSWTVDIRLSIPTNKALNSLLKTGPLKEYEPPNKYSILKLKATLKAVRDDLRDGEDDDSIILEEKISVNEPYPFTYDGSLLTEGGKVPTCGFDVYNFNDHSSVAGEVSVLAYQMKEKKPGYSFSMHSLYHLGNTKESATARSSGKRKGGYIVPSRRLQGTAFIADSSNSHV
jgi:hypothetical protein